MSKISKIGKSFYNLNLTLFKSPLTILSINSPVIRPKNLQCQFNKLQNTQLIFLHREVSTFIPRSFTKFQRNSNIINPSSGISVQHLSQSTQKLCNLKENVENSSKINEQIKNTTVEKEQPVENEIEKEFKEKIESLIKEVDDFKDKYQRSLADRENLRQRLERQIKESKQYGIQSFCKDLLEVTDVFGKAIASVPEEKKTEADSVFISLYDGVVMTENQLISVFRRHGLQKIIPEEGEKFDPSVQEAMFEVPESEGKTPGTIAHVIRTGWKLHDRCIRSAQVGVVKA